MESDSAPYPSEPPDAEPERRDRGEPHLVFCGYCGDRPVGGHVEISRVCGRCHLGLLLRTSAELAPEPSEGFLVVDDLLHVRALSQRAERLLAISETDAVGRHLGELLIPADVTAGDATTLHAAVIHGMLGGYDGGRAFRVAVRPRGEHGVRYAARVSACQPGPAALIVLGELG